MSEEELKDMLDKVQNKIYPKHLAFKRITENYVPKQSRDTWEHIAKNSQKDLVDRIDDIFELRESNKILSTRFDEVFNSLKNLYEETEKLKEHCIEQRFIDWEDESIDGCKDLDKALRTAQEYVFNRA